MIFFHLDEALVALREGGRTQDEELGGDSRGPRLGKSISRVDMHSCHLSFLSSLLLVFLTTCVLYTEKQRH